ncbi:hypothetical protein PV325_013080, partial [Microctonus aethiopoides]
MTDEEATPGRSYVWKLNKAECENELRRFNIEWEPNTTVVNMRQMLSGFLKKKQAATQANQSSTSQPEPEEPADQPQPEESRETQTPATARTSLFQDPDDIIMDTVRAELAKLREQMMADMQARLQRATTQPARRTREIEDDMRPHHRDDDPVVANQRAHRRPPTTRVHPNSTEGQGPPVASKQQQELATMVGVYRGFKSLFPAGRYRDAARRRDKEQNAGSPGVSQGLHHRHPDSHETFGNHARTTSSRPNSPQPASRPSTRRSCPKPHTQKAEPTPTAELTPLTYHTKGLSAAGGVDKEATAVKTAKIHQSYFAA